MFVSVPARDSSPKNNIRRGSPNAVPKDAISKGILSSREEKIPEPVRTKQQNNNKNTLSTIATVLKLNYYLIFLRISE
jgi:hypothetical protein